ncbi:hypothetical protein V8G54_012738 [Vigna mungo]|uniref:Uncharacterized protein n=1 Tax=Vigna mungo TaxID=3915 RepID=A0AAQ3NUU1_VIGMU
MHPENSRSEKKILVEVEHTTNGAGTPGGTEENQTGEGQVENGRTIEENRSDEFRTDLGDDTDGMSGEGSRGKAAGVDLRNYQLVRDRERRISKPTKRSGNEKIGYYEKSTSSTHCWNVTETSFTFIEQITPVNADLRMRKLGIQTNPPPSPKPGRPYKRNFP